MLDFCLLKAEMSLKKQANAYIVLSVDLFQNPNVQIL